MMCDAPARVMVCDLKLIRLILDKIPCKTRLCVTQDLYDGVQPKTCDGMRRKTCIVVYEARPA